jgi:TrmH family RNA methyltransferase
MKSISSRQNSTVRAFRELAASPDATGTRLLVDGVHLVREALAAGAEFEAVAVASSRLSAETEEGRVARALESGGASVFAVADSVFSAMSPVRSPSGIVAIARRTPCAPSRIFSVQDAFTLIAMDIQDPGNLGALIRTAEAGGVTGVLTAGASANPFGWKAVRGSMGSALRLPIAAGLDADAALASVRNAGAKIVAAALHGGRTPEAVEWRRPLALVLGGEGAGLSERVVAQCDERVTIPMAWPVESLNVAVAGALLIYAARRRQSPLDDVRGVRRRSETP